MMTILTGAEFNAKYQGIVFIKLTNEQECHNGFEFKDGLNIDTIPFNPFKECTPGGIYFCEYSKMNMWLTYSDMKMDWYRIVTIPDDAQVYVEHDKFKADKLILSPGKSIWDDNKICLSAVRAYGAHLKYVNDQTDELCNEAIRDDPHSLRYIKNQTSEICMEAVKRNGWSLQHVKVRTPEICIAAVKQYSFSLIFVISQTSEIAMCAVQQNGDALRCVNDQTPEICLAAVQQYGNALQYVKEQTPEICIAALKNGGSADLIKIPITDEMRVWMK